MPALADFAQLEKNTMMAFSDPRCVQQRVQDQLNIDDLTQLEEMSEAAVLWSLKNRYDRNQIYTYIGSILLSVNPYNSQTGLYSTDVMRQYRNQPLGKLPPHLFAIGDAMYNDMISHGQNQVAVISGESGSGKTEACKLLMQYLAKGWAPGLDNPDGSVSSDLRRKSLAITQQILDATPILESFGNARTLRNDNSSRFGKYTEILFKQGAIHGAKITEYLLEKSRIVTQASGERNYHIFYEMLGGINKELRDKFGLSTAQKYFYLNQGRCVSIPGRNDAEAFRKVELALENLGFSGDQQHTIFRILAAILHLGNIYFNRKQVSHQQESVEIGNDGEVQWTAYLLHLDPKLFKEALTTKVTEAGGEKVRTPLDIDRALDVRDAIAKGLYSQLFTWIVKRINQVCNKEQRDSSCALLDIYGFERFPMNSLEQLCINFANERLHSHFVKAVFRDEQAEYARDNIKWDKNIGSALDNEATLSLLTARPHGVFHLLDDESSFPKGSDESFLHKCHYNHVDNSHYSKPRMNNPEFSVRHYAGTVWYQVPGFLDKNRDILTGSLVELLTDSQSSTIASMFKPLKTNRTGTLKSRPLTLSASFCESLQQLISNIKKYKPHFVRCVKPNQTKTGNELDMQVVAEQLAYLGVLETVKIRKMGYPVRYQFNEFAGRYKCLLPKDAMEGKTAKEMTIDALTQQGFTYNHLYQIGSNKVFLKEKMSERMELERERVVLDAVQVLQNFARSLIARRRFLRFRSAAVRIQSATRGWRARRTYHQLQKDVVRSAEREARQSKRLQLFQQLQEKHRKDPNPKQTEAVKERVLAGVQHLDLPKDLDNIIKKYSNGSREERGVDEKVVRMRRHLHHHQQQLNIWHNPQIALPHDLSAHPFQSFANAHFKDSLKIFKLILRFMNETSLNSTQEAILADYIIQQGLWKEGLRDEIYVQLVNQTYQNPNKGNQERGWWLLALTASTFQPSPTLFKFLLNYIVNSASQYGNLISSLLLQGMVHDNSNNRRRYPPSMLEHSAVRHRARMALQTKVPDGSGALCQVEPWITASELAERALAQKGVHGGRGWTVGLETPEVDIYLSGRDYVLDLMSYLELPREFPAAKPNFLIAPTQKTMHRAHQSVNASRSRSSQHQNMSRGSSDNNGTKAVSGARLFHEYNPQHRDITQAYVGINGNSKGPMNSSSSANQSYATTTTTTTSNSVNNNNNNRRSTDSHHHQNNNNNNGRSSNYHYSSSKQQQQQQQEHSPPPPPPTTSSTAKVHYQQEALPTNNNMRRPQSPPSPPPPPPPMPPMSEPTDMRSSTVLMSNHSSRGGGMRGSRVGDYISSNNNDDNDTINLSHDTYEVPRNNGSEIPETVLPSIKDDNEEDEADLVYATARIAPPSLNNNNHPNSTTPTNPAYEEELGNFRRLPSEYSAMSIASHVRRVPLPSKNGDVEKFLDDLFDPIHPDTTMDNEYFDVKSIAASIKGGGDRSGNVNNHEGGGVDVGGGGGPQQQLQQHQPHLPQPFPITQPMIMMVPMDPRMFAGAMQGQMMMQPPTNGTINPSPNSNSISANGPIMMAGAPPAAAALGNGGPGGFPMQIMPFPFPVNGQSVPVTASPGNVPAMSDKSGGKMSSNSSGGGHNQPIPSPPTMPPAEPINTNIYAQKEDMIPTMDDRARTVRVNNVRWPPTALGGKSDGPPPLPIPDDRNPYGQIIMNNNNSNLKNTADLEREMHGMRLNNGGPPIYGTAQDPNNNNNNFMNGNGYQEPTNNNQKYYQAQNQQSRYSDEGGYHRNQSNNNSNNVSHRIGDVIHSARSNNSNHQQQQSSPPQQFAAAHQYAADHHRSDQYANYQPIKMVVDNNHSPPMQQSIYGRREDGNGMVRSSNVLPSNEPPPPPPPHRYYENNNNQHQQPDYHHQEGRRSGQHQQHNLLPIDARGEKERELALQREAVQKMRDQSQRLPPPIDQVRLYQPPGPPQQQQQQQPPMHHTTMHHVQPIMVDQNGMPIQQQQYSPNPNNNDQHPPPVPQHQPSPPTSQQQHPSPPHPPPHQDSGAGDWEPTVKTLEREGRLGEWIGESEVGRRRAENHSVIPSGSSHRNALNLNNFKTAGTFSPDDFDMAAQEADSFINLIDSKMDKDGSKKGPVYSYANVPWEIVVRKELFYPYEQLTQRQLELVYFQIVRDVFNDNPFRIRPYERDQMITLLRSYGVTESNAAAGSGELRVRVVNLAREWPLYFSRLFPVVEDRRSEYVAQLFAVSESGVRLIVRNYDSPSEPLRILDHFDFDDIDRIDTPEPRLVRIFTVRGHHIRVFTDKAPEIKSLIDEYFYGPNQVINSYHINNISGSSSSLHAFSSMLTNTSGTIGTVVVPLRYYQQQNHQHQPGGRRRSRSRRRITTRRESSNMY